METFAALLIAAVIVLSILSWRLWLALEDTKADNRQFISDFNSDRELIEALANAIDDTASNKMLLVNARDRADRRV